MVRTPASNGREKAGLVTRRRHHVLALCLFISGGTALIYEIVWLRQLSLVMGHTAYSLSAVLTAFLGGLALGAYLAGRVVRRRRLTARAYALIEFAIAVSAVAFSSLVAAAAPLFALIYQAWAGSFAIYNLGQFVVCGLLLLLPAVLMGATLPIVTEIVVRDRRDVAVGSGFLYACNSFGAVVGTTLAGFVLLPALGMLRTTLVAASLNIVAGAIAWMASTGAELSRTESTDVDEVRPPEAKASGAAWPPPVDAALIGLYFASGFAALALEVGWTRVVTLSLGSTTYGFALVLATYISGLALGSFVVPRLKVVSRNPVRALFALHLVVAFWTLATLPYLGQLPLRIASAVLASTEAGSLTAAHALTVWSTIFPPTLAMGGMFPLVTQLICRATRTPGGAVGSVYAANTLGNIVGSFTAGFVLVPLIGMHGTVLASAVLALAVGFAYLLPAMRQRPRLIYVAVIAGVAGTTLVTFRSTPWDRTLLTSAPFLYATFAADGKRSVTNADFQRYLGDLIDYREGVSGVASVRRVRGNEVYLQVGGIGEGFSAPGLQNFIAHLPLLLHDNPRDVLIVGLGSGSTLASAVTHPVDHVDCVEISSEVRDLAALHFNASSGAAFTDPRASIIIGDGRNHLRYCARKYDVIVSQPSNTWASGAASLFTREYFNEIRDHLNPNGIACGWFMTYSEASRRSIVRAWIDAFPNAYLFENQGSQAVLIGLMEARPLSATTVAHGLREPAVGPDLARLGLRDVADVLGSLVVGPDGLKAYAGETPPNTDDNGYVEFRGLEGQSAKGAMEALAGFEAYREPASKFVQVDLISPEEARLVTAKLAAIFQQRSLDAQH